MLVTNEEILAKSKSLVAEIKELELYHDYCTLQEQVAQNEELMAEIKKVKELQKAYVKSAYLDKNIEINLKEKLKVLEDNPLYCDYINKEEALNNILSDIKEGLNIAITKFINED